MSYRYQNLGALVLVAVCVMWASSALAQDTGAPEQVTPKPVSMPASGPAMPNAQDFRLEVKVTKVDKDWKRKPAAKVPVVVEAMVGEVVIKKHPAVTNSDGIAVFEGLKMISGARYVPVAAYQESSYKGRVVTPAKKVEQVSIDVYNKTYDDKNLQVSELMTTIQVVEGYVVFFQRWSFINQAPLAFDPAGALDEKYKDGIVLEFPIKAEGINAMVVGQGAREPIEPVESRVFINELVPPGGENQKPLEVQVQFSLKMNATTLDFEQPMLYPTEGIRVIVSKTTESTKFPELDLALSAPGFQVSEGTDMPGLRKDMKFVVARGGHALPGGTLNFSIDNLPARQKLGAYAAFVCIGLLLLLGFFLWSHEVKVLRGTSNREARQRKALEQECESLYEELAVLESRYEDGGLSDRRYDIEAAHLRERLALVLHRLGNEGASA